MAPFRNAVGLVDGKQAQGNRGKSREKIVHGEPLGGDIEQIDAPILQIAVYPGHFPGIHGAVQKSRPQARIARGIDLVFHERDEGADDHADAFENMGRQLVAQ
jgi:hypothetical protein